MRRFWFLLLTGCFVVFATLLLGTGPTPRFAEAKEQTKDDAKKAEVLVESPDEEILGRANVPTAADGLVEFLKKRTLPDADRPEIERLVRRLGSSDYRLREKADVELVQRGAGALEMLRSMRVASLDLETRRRVDRSIQRIVEKDATPATRAAVVRVLAKLQPKNLVEILLGYLPFADHASVIEEIRFALVQHALHDEEADAHLISALTDRSALRRAVAAEAVARSAYDDHKTGLRKLLQDADPFVRYRTARALAFAKDRGALPVLIDALTELPTNDAWQAEDFLLRLAGQAPPPLEAMGNDKDARAKCKLAWHAWWKKHEGAIDLSKLEDEPRLLGRTLIVMLDESRVMELGPDNVPRLEIRGINYPLDAQLIGDDHVLTAEYHAHRVSERNARGEVIWEKPVNGPLAAQRLANGHTFVATDSMFLDYGKDGRLVDSVLISPENTKTIMKAMKLPNGDIVCMTADNRIVRYSPAGKELSSFPIAVAMRLYGGRIHILPTGRVLVPHNAEDKVVEYDGRGKIIWEVPFAQPIAATRLPNGNTIITSMDPAVGAVEVDRVGNEVWSYRGETRVTRAIRR